MPSTITDNSDAGFSVDSGAAWDTSSYAPGYYGTNYRRALPGGNGSHKAFFSFTGLTPSTTYYLGLRWPAHAAHSTDAPWKVHDGNSSATVIGTGTSDQTAAPLGFTDTSVAWQYLGAFVASGTSLTVEVNDGGNNYTAADAALLTATLPTVTQVSIAPGNIQTGSNWNIGTTPDFTKPIVGRHAMTMAVDQAFGDGTDNLFVDFSGPGASLTATGCIAEFKGHGQFGTAAYSSGVRNWLIVQNSGSTPGGIRLNGNSGVTPHILFGRQAKLTVTGQSKSNPSFIETKSGTAGEQGFLSGVSGAMDYLQHDLQFVRLSRLGKDGGPDAFTSMLCTGGLHSMVDVFVDGCGQVTSVINDDGTATLHWNRVKFTNELASPPITHNALITTNGNIPLTSGTRLIERCTFTSQPSIGMVDGTCDDNVFSDWWAMGASGMTESSNLIIKNDGTVGGAGPNLTDNYWYMTAPSNTGWGGNPTFDGTHQGSIFDPGTQSLAESQFQSESTSAITTYKNNLALPGAGVVVNFNNNRNAGFAGNNPRAIFEHNTAFMVGDAPAATGGVTVGLKAGAILSFKSNLLCKLTAATGGNYAFQNQDTGIINGVQGPLEALLASNCDFNGLLNVNNSTTYTGNSHGTPYDTQMPTGSAAPGTHDVIIASDPFVDTTRNLIAWGASLGSANEAETLAHLKAQHDTTDANYDADYTTAALYAWVAAGYNVTGSQGLLLQNAGHDGETIGALPFTSGLMIELGKSGTAASGASAAGNICPAFNGYSPFNLSPYWQEFARDITGDPVDDSSDSIIDWGGSSNSKLVIDFRSTAAGTNTAGTIGIPINIVPSTQPLLNVTYTTYPGAEPPNANSPSNLPPIPIEPTGSFENVLPVDSPPSTEGGGDQHYIEYVRDESQPTRCTLLWEANNAWTEDGGLTFKAHGAAKFDLITGAPRPADITSADAGGLPIGPLLLKYEEVASGDVGHCIRVAIPFTKNRYVWPARCSTGGGGLWCFGGRARLTSSSYATYQAAYAALPQALTILHALRTYGMIMADIAGPGYAFGPFVCGVSDDRWDVASLAAIADIPISAFEIVKQYPGYTVTGNTTGSAGVPVTFTVAKYPITDSNYFGNIYLSVDGIGGGTGLSTSQVSLSDGNPSRTFTYTPPDTATHRLSFAHGNNLWVDAPDIIFNPPTIHKNFRLRR